MQTPKADSPAFPFIPTQDLHSFTPGITILDYFAAQAMVGLISSSPHRWHPKDLADASFEIAKEMVKH